MAQAQVDVVVVGGGLAGLATANRAAQLGLAAVVLEQSTAEKYLCNSRYTGGTLHVAMRDIMKDEGELAEAIAGATGGFVAPLLAQTIAREGRRFVRWLQEEGARFLKASASEHHAWVLAPPGRTRPGLDWEGRAGDVLLRTLGDNLAKRGGRLLRGHRARGLVIEQGRCTGVEVEHAGGRETLRCTAVVIADGGFQSNLDLVGKHVCRQPERIKQRNAGTARGDGLTMAEAAGAHLVGLDRFYGHVLSVDALTNDSLWPYPYLDALAVAGVVVGPDGRRFVDEGRGGVFLANTIAALPDPLSAMIVFDHAIWEGPGRHGLIPSNPHLPKVGGTLHQAADLAGLARAAGLPADALAQTVAAHNAAVANGTLTALTPARGTLKGKPMPIATGPFYAAPLCAGITYTMGGIAVDEHSRALRPDGSPIAGLYAAGASTGGLEGGPTVGYVGGLVKCGVTGLRAAEHIAGSRQSG